MVLPEDYERFLCPEHWKRTRLLRLLMDPDSTIVLGSVSAALAAVIVRAAALLSGHWAFLEDLFGFQAAAVEIGIAWFAGMLAFALFRDRVVRPRLWDMMHKRSEVQRV